LNLTQLDKKKSRLNIAVIGTGIAGMSAAWLLSKRHKVTVFEKQNRVGGHSNTVDTLLDDLNTPVDTGFIVYNELSYPNLIALFDYLDVPTKASNMSFSASLGNGDFEYAGTDVNSLFGQRINIVRPRFWRMLSGVLRFYREAPELLKKPIRADYTIGQYLIKNNYSKGFINDHLLPMGAAIWSTTASEMAEYPALAFIRFFESHGLLLLKNRPNWRTVDGGSKEYVKKITASFADHIQFGGVKSVQRHDKQVSIVDNSGVVKKFDHVVIGTHADDAFRLLSDSNAQEKKLLGSWRYTNNRAVLHTDTSLMPKNRRVWSSWNFIEGHKSSTSKRLCVTYWMNRLQTLDLTTPLFVTLNPVHEPKAGTIIQEFDYTHPFFDQEALVSQQKLWDIQGHRRTWYCGSYFGHGFHEDGLQSGLAVAEQLGGLKRPWKVANENGRIHFNNKVQGDLA
jgi:predicted NAD/FAD-binding protein